MKSRQLNSIWFAALAVLASCAQEQPIINHVQPDYVKKDYLVGADYQSTSDDPEFYSQGTLIDVGYGAGQEGLFTSTYAQPVTRVKWSITENLLIARLAYERISGSDGKGLGKETEDGEVVAAYTIQKHFDIKRSYNPSTGEVTNVLEENDSDRPWYQREFIRVDWSKNLSTDNYDYDMLSMLGMIGGVQYEPMAYYVNDPASPDATHNELETGYLDVTNKA